VLLGTLSSLCYGVEQNLSFEQVKDHKPVGWILSDDKKVSIDKKIINNGLHSLSIENKADNPQPQHFYKIIPTEYLGKKITISGFIKTENVSNGYAGLFMQINPQVARGNMEEQQVSGTTPWTKYQMTLDLNSNKAVNIMFGGEFTGSGKVWFDNLQITIDGINIDKAPLKPILPAAKDHEFDKGSNLTLTKVDAPTIDKLVLLGKVWGFSKYHHPAVARGEHNWDYELFRVLPKLLETHNNATRDNVLSQWITDLGDVELCPKCKPTAVDAVLKPDHQWMNKFELSAVLKDQLRFIYTNRTQGEHYYISNDNGVGNPDFMHENAYKDMQYPDTGFRLLGLYRLWNIIHYYFPSKHLTDNDWNGVLREYIRIFVDASNELEYEQAALQLIAEIKDGHARTNQLWAFQDWIGQNYPPVKVGFVRGKLVVQDFYNTKLKNETGLKLGDVITKINGNPVSDLVKSKQSYYPASNQAYRLSRMSFDLLRSNATSLVLHYSRGNQETALTLKLYAPEKLSFGEYFNRIKKVIAFELLDNNIGYVDLSVVERSDINQIKTQFKDTKGIIVDLRNYPRYKDFQSIGSFFTSTTPSFAKFTSINTNNPGEIAFAGTHDLHEDPITYQGKLIVIVNEGSKSASEYYAMALQAGDNTTVIGSTTAGADGNVSTFYLPGNIQTGISGIGVYYPDGRQTQRVGVAIDIEVLPTIAGIKAGRDELLEEAIKLLK